MTPFSQHESVCPTDSNLIAGTAAKTSKALTSLCNCSDQHICILSLTVQTSRAPSSTSECDSSRTSEHGDADWKLLCSTCRGKARLSNGDVSFHFYNCFLRVWAGCFVQKVESFPRLQRGSYYREGNKSFVTSRKIQPLSPLGHPVSEWSGPPRRSLAS